MASVTFPLTHRMAMFYLHMGCHICSPSGFPPKKVLEQQTRHTLVSGTSTSASLASDLTLFGVVSLHPRQDTDFYVLGVSPGPVCCGEVSEPNKDFSEGTR